MIHSFQQSYNGKMLNPTYKQNNSTDEKDNNDDDYYFSVKESKRKLNYDNAAAKKKG